MFADVEELVGEIDKFKASIFESEKLCTAIVSTQDKLEKTVQQLNDVVSSNSDYKKEIQKQIESLRVDLAQLKESIENTDQMFMEILDVQKVKNGEFMEALSNIKKMVYIVIAMGIATTTVAVLSWIIK